MAGACQRMIADYKTFIVTDGKACATPFTSPVAPSTASNASTPPSGISGRPRIHAKLEDKIIDDLKAPWVQGITFLGGEPFLNTPVLVPLAQRIRQEFGHTKDIWSWTGYTWEELMRPGETPDKLELLHLIDILVDGRYLRDQKDSLLQFRGSRNQRILDVPKSLEAGEPVIWAKLHDQERDIPEIYLKDREAGEGQQAS